MNGGRLPTLSAPPSSRTPDADIDRGQRRERDGGSRLSERGGESNSGKMSFSWSILLLGGRHYSPPLAQVESPAALGDGAA